MPPEMCYNIKISYIIIIIMRARVRSASEIRIKNYDHQQRRFGMYSRVMRRCLKGERRILSFIRKK